MKNSQAIAFTKTYRGRIQLFVVSGYMSYLVNGHNYVQALCHPLESSSCSSFVDTPFKRLLPVTVTIPRDPIPISLYRLHVGEVFPLMYDNGNLTISITTLSINQWTTWKHDLLFHRSYNKTEDRKRHSLVCSQTNLSCTWSCSLNPWVGRVLFWAYSYSSYSLSLTLFLRKRPRNWIDNWGERMARKRQR